MVKTAQLHQIMNEGAAHHADGSTMSDKNRRTRTPPNPTASGDDALVLRGKVEKLLLVPESRIRSTPTNTTTTATARRQDPTSYDRKYGTERNFVALVLLTRLEAPYAAHVLVRHPEMGTFCRQLVTPPPTSSSSSPSHRRNLFLYSRLVAQVISACLGELGSGDGATATPDKLLEDLGSLLTQLLENAIAMGTFTALDVDLVAALAAFLSTACHDPVVTDSLLLRVWDRCASVLEQHDGSKATQPSSDPSEGKEPVTPDELLEATLGSILNQNSVWAIESDDEHFCGNLEWWEVQTGNIFVDHACRPQIDGSPRSPRPSYFVPMLKWWLRSRKDSKASLRTTSHYSAVSSPSPWPHVLLRCIQQNPGGFHDLNRDAHLARDVLQLVLACVVNTTADDSLRGQAWSALSSLVSTAGWDWMQHSSSSSSSSLGRASRLCAILRMASGEYKIQLNHRLYGSMGSIPAERPSDRESLAEECCRFLSLSLQYIADVAERYDEDENDTDEVEGGDSTAADPARVQLSSAAILHIRKSLHEALMCSAQYCGELTRFDANCDSCVVRLFGALLSEFDVFLESRLSQDDDHGEHHSILNALRSVLRWIHDVDRDACESLLPGLLMIFASAEGDDDRAAILKPYLADFVGFFEYWWAESARLFSAEVDDGGLAASVSSIECAWNVLELWHDVVVRTSVIVEVGSLQGEILHFLSVLPERLPNELHDDSPMVRALSAGVSSYLVLQGDDAPCEPDASAIRRAVEVLQRSKVAS